ncbi:MAG: glycosyltransferase family 39 protein [Magnetococcales bacterium]|nr:glycosyltransferase family 39 protein [Magnetococcales bacterium]
MNSKYKPYFQFSLILLTGLILRLIAFGGFIGGDDAAYIHSAERLYNSGFSLGTSHYSLRFGLHIPLAGMIALFGSGEWAMVALSFISSIGAILLAFLLGRWAGNVRVGLFSALVIAVFPLDVELATTLVPDILLGTLLASSIYLALQNDNHNQTTIGYLSAGLIWGWAYLIRIDVAFLGPFFIAWFFLQKPFTWQRSWVFIGVGLVLLGENLIYFTASGEWLYRLKIVAGGQGDGAFYVEAMAGQELSIFPKAWFLTPYQFGLHYFLLAASIIWGILHGGRKTALLLTWLLGLLLWLEFGGSPSSLFSEGGYVFKSHLLRYCAIVSIPMAVMVGLFLASRSQHGQRILSLALVGAALFMINFNMLNHERPTSSKIAIREAMDQNWFPLYLDITSYHIARFIMKDDQRLNQVHNLQDHNFITGETKVMDLRQLQGYILINKQFMKFKNARNATIPLNVEENRRDATIIYRVDNPMWHSSYVQTRFMAWMAENFIPVANLRDKILGTANSLLEDGDVLVYQLK